MNDVPQQPANQLPPHVRLMTIVAGKWMAQPLVALAELDVAGALADGPLTARALAERVGADPDALHRVLRAAAGLGVVRRDDTGAYHLTELGTALRGDVPDSLRDFTRLMGAEPVWTSFAGITDTVRTGAPAFETRHGRTLFDHLDDDPALAAVYQGAWASLTRELVPEAVAAYDFSRFRVLADVGGGHGELLTRLLATAPASRGVLVDREEVVRAAREKLAGTPEAERITYRPAGQLPDDADAYLMKNVLHCFDDEAAGALLREVADAMRGRPESRLLLIEAVVPDDDSFHWSKFIDVEVLVNNGGRERTETEWRSLLEKAGLALEAIVPVTHPQSVIEARPAG